MPILSVEYLSGICFENVSTLFGCWRVRCSVRPKAQVLLEEEEETRRTTYSLDYWQMCRHFLLTNWHSSTLRPKGLIHTSRSLPGVPWTLNTKCQTEFSSFFFFNYVVLFRFLHTVHITL
jgi:hypothetical protein